MERKGGKEKARTKKKREKGNEGIVVQGKGENKVEGK